MEKSLVRLPVAVDAFEGTLIINPAVLEFEPLISVAVKTILREDPPALEAACVVAVLLIENVVPPEKLPVLVNEIDDFPAVSADEPVAAAADDFLHEVTVIIRPAITNDNEIIFFILIVFNYE